jgi:hypothetical protein
MKARNPLERRSTSGSRSSYLPSQDRILQQIKTTTGELDRLQAEIYRLMSKPGEISRKKSPAHEAATAETLAQFKAALDRLRGVLWFYIEQFAHPAQVMKREWEPLRHEENRPPDLHQVQIPQSCGLGLSNTDPPGSFFDRLNVMIDTCMKSALPPPASARKRVKL